MRLENGGRIVVLGEGMASLFLGDPNGREAVRQPEHTNDLLGKGQRHVHGGGARLARPAMTRAST